MSNPSEHLAKLHSDYLLVAFESRATIRFGEVPTIDQIRARMRTLAAWRVYVGGMADYIRSEIGLPEEAQWVASHADRLLGYREFPASQMTPLAALALAKLDLARMARLRAKHAPAAIAPVESAPVESAPAAAAPVEHAPTRSAHQTIDRIVRPRLNANGEPEGAILEPSPDGSHASKRIPSDEFTPGALRRLVWYTDNYVADGLVRLTERDARGDNELLSALCRLWGCDKSDIWKRPKSGHRQCFVQFGQPRESSTEQTLPRKVHPVTKEGLIETLRIEQRRAASK